MSVLSSAGAKVGAANALEVRGVSAGYGSGDVIRGVSIAALAGKVTALLGPNGAGKTTLLRCISGLLTPSSGDVLVDGVPVTGWTPEARSRKGLLHITEGRGVYRSLTVRENLVMQSPRRREKETLALASEVFPILGRRLKQVAGTMSGGEQQMLALAAAYVRSASMIVVDEPSLGLAPLIVDTVFEHLQALSRTGVSLLLVDQFAHRALAMAEEAFVLGRGRIVYSGKAAELAKADVFDYYLRGEAE